MPTSRLLERLKMNWSRSSRKPKVSTPPTKSWLHEHWRKLAMTLLVLFWLSALLTSSGCCKAHVEVRYIETKLHPAPLPPEILQAMQPNSTELLKRAENWSESSGKLLDSVTTK